MLTIKIWTPFIRWLEWSSMDDLPFNGSTFTYMYTFEWHRFFFDTIGFCFYFSLRFVLFFFSICTHRKVSMHKMQLLIVLLIDAGILCEYFSYKLMLLVMKNFGSRVFFLIFSDRFQPMAGKIKKKAINKNKTKKNINFPSESMD